MAGVQLRLATLSTSEDYVTGKQWLRATLAVCPWHPKGGCGFSHHGTYPRVRPVGTLIARWYCPTERRTVSALPDCLASHFSGTLEDLEAHVGAVEQARSLCSAAERLRTEIELPGALRYLSRLCKAIHSALNIIRGLIARTFLLVEPSIQSFAGVLGGSSVLMSLREIAARYLPQLPTPLGFNPSQIKPELPGAHFQHRSGRDPPVAIVEPADHPGRRPDKEQMKR